MKVPDVERLTLCRYQDNLEFCQWMKAYHGNKWSGADYDPIQRRGKGNETMHYILGGNKVGAPPPKAVPKKAKYDVPSTFSKIGDSLASNGAANGVSKTPGTVKSMGGKGSAVDAAEIKKLNAQVAEM